MKRTPEELKRLADRQLARIRRGEPMLTLERLPSRCEAPRRGHTWREGGNGPNKLSDVST